MHELQLHQDATYITLTYDKEHLPENGNLKKSDWQSFAKALRHARGSFRFLACGEYGSDRDRPHFHAVLFGISFNDQVHHSTNESGDHLFTSASLGKIWTKGFHLIGGVEFDSVCYVAGYIQKKVNGKKKEKHYYVPNRETGEMYHQVPEFGLMSRGDNSKDPITGFGLGHGWISRFHREVYPRDEVIVNGHLASVPDYYDRWYEKHHPDKMEEVKKQRKITAAAKNYDNSPKQLAKRKANFVAKAKR